MRLDLGPVKREDDNGDGTRSFAAASIAASTDWVPLHVILGGWGKTTARDTIVAQIKEWLQTQSDALKEMVL